MVCTWDVTKRNGNVSQQQLVDIKRHPWPKIRVSHLRRKVIIIIIIIIIVGGMGNQQQPKQP